MSTDQHAETESSPQQCPKCSAARVTTAEECPECGIIFAKYRSASEASVQSAPTTPRRNPTGLLLVAGVIVIGVTVWIWQRSSGPEPLAANELRITYEHGETCKWTDWSFSYLRFVSNNKARGNVMIVGPRTRLNHDDKTLRVFSPDGEKLTIPAADLREMILTVSPDPDNSSNNEVQVNKVVSASGSYYFEATPLPKFSRSRVLVPVISHYFPEHSDKYMSWGNARLILMGTVAEHCSTDRVISLTRPGHPKKRTPVHVEFPGA
jgi:hypothetical protein